MQVEDHGCPQICDEIKTLTKLECLTFAKCLSLSDIKSKWKQDKIVAALEAAIVDAVTDHLCSALATDDGK